MHPGQTAACTPRYAAPETLLFSQTSTGSDMYSFGLVVWETLTGASGSSHRVRMEDVTAPPGTLDPEGRWGGAHR